MLRILDKPAGLTTHTSLSEQERKNIAIDPVDSFLGHLSHRSGVELWPVHRLDVGTTGVMIAADNSIEAAALSKLFESRDIEKTYYFLTDRSPNENFEATACVVESFIERRGDTYVSIPTASDVTGAVPATNAITAFSIVKKENGLALWQARPKTGRPHQIRLHAEALGIPILGDEEHGGSSFPTLCLHAAKIEFEFGIGLSDEEKKICAESPMPRWFQNLTLASDLANSNLLLWLRSIERRERLKRSLEAMGVASENSTQRWIHKEDTELSVDQLGSIFQFHWYGENFDDHDFRDLRKLADTMGWKDWYLQRRDNRGKNPNSAEMIPSRDGLPERWTGHEEGMSFGFRRDSGLSAGLFLDQRANRRWLRLVAKEKSVLNLFSYTGGFSVAAALGGASKVVTVDLSKNFVAWSKENFALNGLSEARSEGEARPYEFRAMEARDYLRWAKKKGLLFDFVICDPPSFSRSEEGVFRIEKDFESLIESCLDVVAPEGGTLLFSTNYELMKEEEFFERAKAVIKNRGGFSLERAPSPDLDFEFPREPLAMKSLKIRHDQQ